MSNGDQRGTPAWRRWGIAAFAICAASIGGYAILPNLIPHDLVRDRIDQQIERLTGGSLRLREDAEIMVGRGFRVAVSDPVFVSSADAASDVILLASQLDAQLRRLPMLMGRIEIASLRLRRPEFQLGENGEPFALWPEVSQAEDHSARPPRVPASIVIVDGTIGLDHSTDFTDVDLTIASNEDVGDLRINGGFVMGASRLYVDLHMDDPRQLFNDGGSNGVLSVWFEPEDEHGSGYAEAKEVDVTTRIKKILRTVGLIGPGPLVIDGRFDWKPRAITISNATFSMADTTLDGHLNIRTVADNSMAVQLQKLHTLAHTSFSEAANEIRTGDWPAAPVSSRWLDGLNIDFDLAGTDLLFGTATLDMAAISFTARERAVSLSVKGESEQFGRLEAKLNYDEFADRPASVPMVSISGRVDDASMSDIADPISRLMLPRLTGAPQMPEGTLAANFDLYGQGRTLGQIVDSLNGSVTASLENGSLTGGDVITTLESLSHRRQFMTAEKGPLIPAAGRTPFDIVKGRAGVRAGRAQISQLTIAGGRFEINMLGEVLLKRGLVNIVGSAHLFATPETKQTAAIKSVDLPFGIGGRVFAPVVGAGVPYVDAMPPQ